MASNVVRPRVNRICGGRPDCTKHELYTAFCSGASKEPTVAKGPPVSHVSYLPQAYRKSNVFASCIPKTPLLTAPPYWAAHLKLLLYRPKRLRNDTVLVSYTERLMLPVRYVRYTATVKLAN